MSSIADSCRSIKDALPPEAKDLKLNLGSVIERSSLSDAEAAGAALAAAIMARSVDLVEAFLSVDELDDVDLGAFKGRYRITAKPFGDLLLGGGVADLERGGSGKGGEEQEDQPESDCRARMQWMDHAGPGV